MARNKPDKSSLHSNDHSGNAPVTVHDGDRRPHLADGKGLNAFGLGDGNHYTDVLKPMAPHEAGIPPMARGTEHAVDNTFGNHDGGKTGAKRKA